MRPAGFLLLILSMTTTAATADERPSTVGCVRPRDAAAERLIQIGRSGSSTFARLLNDVERAGGVVYVDVRSDGRIARSGRLQFAGAANSHRYLHIGIDTGTTSPGLGLMHQLELVAMLGHELQHALEVAVVPAVDSLEAFEALYRAIGVEMRPRTFDTIAARHAGQQVLTELREGIRAE